MKWRKTKLIKQKRTAKAHMEAAKGRWGEENRREEENQKQDSLKRHLPGLLWTKDFSQNKTHPDQK